MENAVDALKMAGAAMLFILAFTVAMVMFSKARDTSDAVLESLQLKDFFSRVDPLDENVTREVGIETIIPTLYRYCQSDENIMVRIVGKKADGTKTEYQVFDQSIETAIAGLDLTNEYHKALKEKYDTSTKKAYMYGAPWANQTGNQYRLERINAYIYGIEAKHMPELNNKYISNNLMKIAEQCGNKFEESYLEYRKDGNIQIDEYGEEIVTIPASKKVIITYTFNE